MKEEKEISLMILERCEIMDKVFKNVKWFIWINDMFKINVTVGGL